MSSHYQRRRDAIPGRVELHVPQTTILSEHEKESILKQNLSRGSIGKRIGAQFCSENKSSSNKSEDSGGREFGNRHYLRKPIRSHDVDSVDELDSMEHFTSSICTKNFTKKTARLGDTFISSSNLKTGIILEDNDIGMSRTTSDNWPDVSLIQDRDSTPAGLNIFEDMQVCMQNTIYNLA